MGSSEPVLLRRDEDGIAWLTLNRPAQRNALSVELMSALQREVDAVGKERKVKVVVGAGGGLRRRCRRGLVRDAINDLQDLDAPGHFCA